MVHSASIAALSCYLIASFFFCYSVLRKESRRNKIANIALLTGLVLQTLVIYPILSLDQSIVPESRADYFFLISWVLPLMFFIFNKKLGYSIIGSFIAPASALFMISSSYLVHLTAPGDTPPLTWVLVAFHILPALLAEVSIVLVFIISAVYLIQERRISRKYGGSMVLDGPNLRSLENTNIILIKTGFLAMSFAVISGVMIAFANNSPLLSDDFYQWSAVFVWLLLAIYLHFYTNHSWSNKKVSKVVVLTIGIFLFSFLLMVFSTGNSMHLR